MVGKITFFFLYVNNMFGILERCFLGYYIMHILSIKILLVRCNILTSVAQAQLH
jgi:hypothetical protein